MSMMSLGPGRSTTISARGMVHVDAHPVGDTSAVAVEVRGAATVHRIGAAEVHIMRPHGVLDIVVRPEAGGVFGPNQRVLARVIRGRVGSPGASGVELPRAIVDGCREYTVGTLTVTGDHLQVAAPGAPSDTVDGPAATVHAGLRARLTNCPTSLADALPVVVYLDASASMAHPSAVAKVDTAADIIRGAIAALPVGPSITVCSRGVRHEVGNAADLGGVLRHELHVGQARVGAMEDLSAGLAGHTTEPLVWVISDAVPTRVREGSVQAVALVVGDGDQTTRPTEITLDEPLIRSLTDGDLAGSDHLIAAIVAALPGADLGGHR